jgi:ferredoxin
VRLAVDAGQCTGHGRCYTLAPDLLAFDDEGYVTIRGESIAVPDDLKAVATYAADSCPEGAVTLIAE